MLGWAIALSTRCRSAHLDRHQRAPAVLRTTVLPVEPAHGAAVELLQEVGHIRRNRSMSGGDASSASVSVNARLLLDGLCCERPRFDGAPAASVRT